jgi:hypothetical protein
MLCCFGRRPKNHITKSQRLTDATKSIFSTDIVKFQSSEPSPAGTSFSSLALQRWLEVTFPLTFLTLVLGYCGYRYEKGRQRNEIEEQRSLQLEKLGRGGTL